MPKETFILKTGTHTVVDKDSGIHEYGPGDPVELEFPSGRPLTPYEEHFWSRFEKKRQGGQSQGQDHVIVKTESGDVKVVKEDQETLLKDRTLSGSIKRVTEKLSKIDDQDMISRWYDQVESDEEMAAPQKKDLLKVLKERYEELGKEE